MVCAAAAGCGTVEVGPEKTITQTIPLDDTEMVTAELKISAGTLRVSTHAGALMDARFRYNVEAWKPVVRYNALGFRGHLTLEQPKSFSGGGNMIYEWDLKFNEKKPLDLKVNLGAGEAEMNLGGGSLRGLEVNMGVGKLDLDLRGAPERSYTVRINGGVGEAVVKLPTTVRIRARAHGGLGSIESTGLVKRGDTYENASAPATRASINLEIRGGVGTIRLLAE